MVQNTTALQAGKNLQGNYMGRGINSQWAAVKTCFNGAALVLIIQQYWTAVWPVNSRGQTNTGPAKPEELTILSYIHLPPEILSDIVMHSSYPTDLGYTKTIRGLLTSISILLVSDVFPPLTNSYKKNNKTFCSQQESMILGRKRPKIEWFASNPIEMHFVCRNSALLAYFKYST